MGDINEGLRRMMKVVNYLLSRGDAAPFAEPVDWRGLGLYDYPKVIKKVRAQDNCTKIYRMQFYFYFSNHGYAYTFLDDGFRNSKKKIRT